MKEVINYGEARRQQILKGFTNAEEAADEPIEKARHGVYADNAQNRRLQRVGQEYGQAAKEDPEGEGQEGGIPEGNVSLQNHARQASEEALTKVANDPQADPEMRKVATAELERRGVSVRAKNKNGDTSLRNGLADGDAKSASTFEGMGFRQMDDQDLQQYAGVEDASHAFIKQIGGDEDGFDLVVTKTSEGYRVDKYPYADVDNFESVTVKEIGDVEGAASKFGDPDAKGKGGKADAASLVDSFNAMAENDTDFDTEGFKSFVKQKGDAAAIKELAAAMKANPADTGGAQSDATDDEIADTIANMFEMAGVKVSKDGQKELDALIGGEEESATKQGEKADAAAKAEVKNAEKGAKAKADKAAKSSPEKDNAAADKFIKKTLKGAKQDEFAKMIVANPGGIARALREKISAGDKDAKVAANHLTTLMDPYSRDMGISNVLLTKHPELKKLAEERDAAAEALTGVYDPEEYKKKSNEQIEVWKRTQKEFVDKFLDIYGGKTEE